MRLCGRCSASVQSGDVANYRNCDNQNCQQVYCVDCFFLAPSCAKCGQRKAGKGMIVDFEMPRDEDAAARDSAVLGI